MRKVIINSTPIIALGGMGMLELLKKMYGEVIIPQAVYDEIGLKPDSRSFIELKKSLSWVQILPIQNQMAKRFFKTQLHVGEVEVMILATEQEADLVVMDDANAKKHAMYLGLNVIGTLGILVKCKEQGFLNEVKPLLDQMSQNGFRISENLRKIVLVQSNEL